MGRSQPADAWSHELARAFAGLHAERRDGLLPLGTLDAVQLDDVGIYDVRGTTQIVRRTSRTARTDTAEQLKICLIERGGALVEQGRRRVALEVGDLALYDLRRPYQLTLQGAFRCAVMTFPREALGLPDSALEVMMERRFVTGTGVGQVFASCLRSALDQRETLSDGSPVRLREAAVALLAATLGSGAGLPAGHTNLALRERVLDHVRGHLADPHLSPATVAAALHMSPRSLHRLFEDSGETFGGTVRRLRLEAVRRDLTDPLLAGRSIAAVATRWGITDQPWLSRAFRAEYGVTPSGLRRRMTGS
ncbi:MULTISPECIES: helix-turn-helix domain-containing protein [unclassified Amycolatopsis]|uniref:AraC-like ligand-binding domain-containing protein n=1 Tax=unclassified Amycolatopsis TaxID=2618356 RepID=UPI001C69E880|nr:helix-turn-helix domain-containing protein [Amycolatopsis sp. DSM 110486]QYN22386.1 helix-turn-helix domain-containing protein [Amycolatopsis sp. DSM 110486]